MSHLSKAMGLKAGSIYAAFENKEGLFEEALQRYCAQVASAVAAGSMPAKKRLEHWFALEIQGATAGPQPRGCLLMASLVELPQLDESAQSAIREALENLTDSLRALVRSARCATPRAEPPEEAAVQALLGTLAGISALSRGGIPEAKLRQMADASLSLV